MITAFDIIRAIMRTEKSTRDEPERKYLLLVDKSSNKIQIKHAVEELYKVKVQDVNTLISPGKLKRVRYQLGRTPNVKKAVVTLKEGYKISEAIA